jgi:hypothetical protein
VDRIGAKKRVVFGDSKGDEFDDVGMFTFGPRARPDGLRRPAGPEALRRWPEDGGAPDYDEIWALTFENQARSVAFDARDGNDFWRISMKVDYPSARDNPGKPGRRS